MVLIQEMALKVDQGFLGAISALFTPTTDPEAERKRVTIFISWENYKTKKKKPAIFKIVIEKKIKIEILDLISFRQS